MLAPGTFLFHKRYRIVRHLREGGQGVVYEGYEIPPLDRTVAIKETSQNEDWALGVFEKEASLLAKLHHPAIPQVYNYFCENGSAFLVMRFIPGDDLDTLLKKRSSSFSTEEILTWADQLLDALQYLESRGIVHRDINPRNLKLDGRDQIILLDFGIAKDSSSRTPTYGGSPRYSSPEQLKDEGTDARSDLYSLAATIYHLLTGIAPPDATDREVARIKGQPDILRPIQEMNQQVAPGVANVFMLAMSLDRDERPVTVTLMRRELRDAIQNRTNLYPTIDSTPSSYPATSENLDETKPRRRVTIQLPENNKNRPHVPTDHANRRSTRRPLRIPHFRKLLHPIGRMLGARPRSVVGLDIGSSALKAIELKPIKGGFELLHIAHQIFQPAAIIDGQIVNLNHVRETIDRVWTEQNIMTHHVATSISGHGVIVKKITLPAMPEDELHDQIHWEAEQYIPFDINEVNLYHEIVSYDQTGQHMDVLLVACKRDKIAEVSQVISMAGKQTFIVDVDAFALQNTYEVNYLPAPNQTVALVNIGASVTTMNITRGVTSLFTRDIAAGGNQYTQRIQSELNLTFEQAEALKCGMLIDKNLSFRQAKPSIEAESELLALEIERTLEFFRTTALVSTQIDRMLLAGGSSKMLDLVDSFSERFKMPVELLDSFRRITFDTGKFDSALLKSMSPGFAIALGLAVRVMEVAR